LAKCSFCEEGVEYLPFGCSYCGNKFCKKHRLPENHNCSLEFKDSRNLVKKIISNPEKTASEIDVSQPNFRKANFQRKEQPEGSNRFQPTQRMNPFGFNTKLTATYVVMGLILFFFLVQVILDLIEPEANRNTINSLQHFITLSYAFTFGKSLFYTILTAMFLPESIISLIFNLLVIYSVGKLIEGRFGWKVFIKIYLISGLITGGMVILCQILFSITNAEILYFGFSTTSGSILGLITFMIMLLPRGEIRLLFFKIKTKNIIWILVGFYMVFGIISHLEFVFINLYEFPSFIVYYASTFGVLGGYITIRGMFRQPQPTVN
jgi:membrane associated rhomboid family serine protease